MNFLSINICGLGSDVKSAWIKGLKLENKISFLAIQEIQIGDFSFDAASKLWGNNYLEMDFMGVTGRSGGLVSIWDPNLFRAQGVSKDRYFLHIWGHLVGSNQFINIINVYAPRRVSEKKDYGMLYRGWSARGTVCGFYWEILMRCYLIEYGMKGRSFTFMAPNSNKLSKIDRMLVCKYFFDKWPDACLRALPRLHSDHSPVILVSSSENFGVKPFRDRIKDWRKELVKKEREDMERDKEELDALDILCEEMELSEEELWIKEECVKNIRERERWAIMD
ncbi:uncharacterized protein LOC110866782 [Helianthus annuus]|uniref:uncharacterized protein LOC110866782 n=1 Tax=Helianthus annuus TaxID=4232 RepID=UPI000B8F804C|nr:uncharacterized protein LOC110866782 [Helianthus annuus]